MNAYEICILNSSGHTKIAVQAAHASDFSAVRSAQKLANGDAVEVWRDLECIYRDQKDDRKSPHHAA